MVLLSAREQKSSGSGKQQSELWNKSIQIDYLCCCLACLFSMPALLFIFDAVFRTHRRHHFQTQEEEEKTCTNRRIGVNGNLLCTWFRITSLCRHRANRFSKIKWKKRKEVEQYENTHKHTQRFVSCCFSIFFHSFIVYRLFVYLVSVCLCDCALPSTSYIAFFDVFYLLSVFSTFSSFVVYMNLMWLFQIKETYSYLCMCLNNSHHKRSLSKIHTAEKAT